MIVLGIDPGSHRTGYALLEAGPERCVLRDFGTLELSSRARHGERLAELYARLLELIRSHRPEVCALEMPVYGKNPQAMLKLGRAQAAAMLAAVHEGVPVVEYPPTEIKKAATGRGNASKEQVWQTLHALLGLGSRWQRPTADASDALAVAYCHVRRHYLASGSRRGWWAFVQAHPDRVLPPARP
jgi:crossover junction endodeoxyribonuclease RuvC|nr:MAG: crossover junction endodeoxyribonuclease RuvC [Bacteroidota bacterium]